MRDFRAQQARARLRTRVLILLYAAMLPVVAGVAAVAMVVGGAIAIVLDHERKPGDPGSGEMIRSLLTSEWTPALVVLAAIVVAAVMVIASAWRWRELRAGGSRLAESVGARRLSPDSSSPDERRLLNVAEEMAIAARMPVPPVFVLEQPTAINAFAAGCTPDDAVVVVTRGTLRAMNRDQLQGVMGHEFSHILNGDMRLNVVLISLVHGIAAIGFIGDGLLQAPRDQDSKRSSLFLIIGVLLKAVGFVGVACGSILQAAVSRQREFLADASAVEFTRQPGGLAGALKIVGGVADRGRLPPSVALQCNHMCIVEAKANALLRSHPSLERRIQRLDPGWNGAFEPFEFPATPEPTAPTPSAAPAGPIAGALPLAPVPPVPLDPPYAAGWAPMDVLERVEAARSTICSIRPDLLEVARTLFDAEALVLAMLLSRRIEVASAQVRLIRESLGDAAARLAASLRESLAGEPRSIRMPLLLVAMGTLGGLSPAQYDSLRTLMIAMIEANPRTDLFKLCVFKSARARLDRRFGRPRPSTAYYSLATLGPQCSTLLSAVAMAGGLTDFDEALRRAGRSLGVTKLAPVPAADLSAARIAEAIGTLATASSPHRWRLVEACAAMAGADHALRDPEHEMLSAIADALRVPLTQEPSRRSGDQTVQGTRGHAR